MKESLSWRILKSWKKGITNAAAGTNRVDSRRNMKKSVPAGLKRENE